jgi:hypothetical protein
MATAIRLVHPSGGVKQGYYGFSWTTFFFGIWPALFRGDFLTFLGGFVIIIILAVCTYRIGSVIAGFVWAFIYNGYYTRRLLQAGYRLDGSPSEVQEAARCLRLSPSLPQAV